MKARSLWVFATTTLAVGFLVPTATSLNRSSETGKTTPVKETKVDVPAEMRYAHEPIFQKYFEGFLGDAKSALENVDNLREGPFGVSRIPVTTLACCLAMGRMLLILSLGRPRSLALGRAPIALRPNRMPCDAMPERPPLITKRGSVDHCAGARTLA
jgi:hypothetical protein